MTLKRIPTDMITDRKTGKKLSTILSEVASTTDVNSFNTRLNSAEKKIKGYVNIFEYDVVGDGETDDQDGIVLAVADAKAKGYALHWGYDGQTFVSSENIPNFHDVVHVGNGKIKRDDDIFHIYPRYNDTNILYSGYRGLTTNDGLSAAQPRKLSSVKDTLKELGDKALVGQWRVQFVAGTFTDTGITFNDLPYFSQPLQFWGVWDGTNRLAIWDGNESAAVYAFRADGTNNTLNLEFKDLKFINWKADPSNAGAIVAWYGVNVRTDNVEVRDSTVAIWCRGGWSRHYSDVIDNCVWGYGFQYSHSASIGSSIYARNKVSNCDKGIMLGRSSVIHADYTDFTDNLVDIHAHQKSRVATVNSTFARWGDVSFWMQGDAIHEKDGAIWDAASIKDATPIYRFENGSSVPEVHVGPLPYRAAHFAPATGYTLTGTTTETLLSAQTGFGTPLRMPKNMLYNNGTLQIKIVARIDVGGSGGTKKVRLTGPSSSAAYEIAFIDIPAGGGLGELTFEVIFKPNGSAFVRVKYDSSNASLNVLKFSPLTSTVMNVLRDGTQDIANWRLYASLANAADSLSIFFLTTTITG